MNYLSNRLALIPMLFFLSANLVAKPGTVWEKHPDYIAKKYTTNNINYDHPKKISVGKIARLLSQVKVKNGPYTPNKSLWNNNEAKPVRLFTDKEIDLLSNKLSQELAKLSSNEKIIFSISDYRSSFIGKKKLSVSGSVFINNNRLNLLLGEVHIELASSTKPSSVTNTYGRIKNELSTGDVRYANERKWELLTFEGAVASAGRKDWLSIDLGKNYSFAQSDNEQRNNKYLAHEQKKLSNETLDKRLSTLEASIKSDLPSSNIESRLRELKRLYLDGILPEKIYLEKVRLVMEEL